MSVLDLTFVYVALALGFIGAVILRSLWIVSYAWFCTALNNSPKDDFARWEPRALSARQDLRARNRR
jgi:hypothetical protein